MHVSDHAATGAEPIAVLLQAVKETARSACHLADVAARVVPHGRDGCAEAAAYASLEAGLRASRALFALEDSLACRPDGPGVLADALCALEAAEDALHAAHVAVETRVSRSLRPDAPAGAAARP